MKVVLCLLSLLAVSASALDYKFEFTNFMLQYSKVYTHHEFQTRFSTFSSNLDYIHSFNNTQNGVSLGVNAFADLSHKEFKATYLGLSKTLSKVSSRGVHVAADSIPASKDWRTEGVVTPVQNQGLCNSGYAFSATGSLEGIFKILHPHFPLYPLSEQSLIDCSGDPDQQLGCSSGSVDQAFEYIISNWGIMTETSYPYTATQSACHYSIYDRVAHMESYVMITAGSESALTDAIATVGPISVNIDASQPSFQFYTSGVYDDPHCSSTTSDHSALAVGYATSGGRDYYIVKNSWGTQWGKDGYIWMLRNANNRCGIATSALYPVAEL